MAVNAMRHGKRAAVVACLMALSSPALCASWSDWVKVDGFGTVGAYMADDPIATARVDGRQSSGSRDGQWRYDGDTQLSVQATVNPAGPWRAVLQMLSKKDYQGSQQPHVEWAYASWQARPELNIKLGRTVIPVYLDSDFRNLFYAQTWARPPSVFYGQNNVTYQDGLSLVYEQALGGGDLGLEAFAGQSSVRTQNKDGSTLVKLPKLGGVVARWSDDTFLLRLAYSRYQLDIEQPAAVTAAFNALINLPAAQCLNCAQILPVRYRTHDVNASLLTVGGSARLGDTLLQGEWQRRLSNSNFLNDVSAWYVHASHRVGQFTPYVSWGRSTVREPRLGLRPGPNASPAFASRLEFIDRLGLQGVGERRQLDLGLRWDFREAMALKAQWTRHDITQRDIGSGQAVTFPIPSSRFDGRVNVYSLNVDFVF